jgi:hypothetical protein
MELSPSWEVASCAATQESPSILWNTKFPYHVHKSPPLVPILRQISPVHITQSYLSKSILILSSHLRLGVHSGLFPSGFPTGIVYAFICFPMRAICPPHLILPDIIILLILREMYKIRSSSLCS